MGSRASADTLPEPPSRAQPTFAIAGPVAPPELAREASDSSATLAARLRLAYGDAAVVPGAQPGSAAIAIVPTLARAPGGLDLGLTLTERATSRVAVEHVRIAEGAPFPSSATLVGIIDRATILPPQPLAAAPIVALAPLHASDDLAGQSAAATTALAQRLREAGFADVRVLAGDVTAATTVPGARISVIGSLVRTGSRYAMRLDSFGDDRSALASLTVALTDTAVPPASALFAPFVAQSLALAPQAIAGNVDALVLPFDAPPELAEAAAAARIALVDRLVAAGTRARAIDAVPANAAGIAAATGAKLYVTGSFAKPDATYALDLVGHTTANAATVPAHLALAAPAAFPGLETFATFATAMRDVKAPPTHTYLFVPFANPSNKDGYVAFANAEYAKILAERGYKLAPKADLDAVDARLEAADLCRTASADGILIASRIEHDQEYHKGAMRTAGSFLGFFTFGLANVAMNAINNIASDDRYVNRASLTASFIDCAGKRVWGKTVQGGNSHYGRNAAAGGSGAISDALGQLVGSMLDAVGPPAPVARAK